VVVVIFTATTRLLIFPAHTARPPLAGAASTRNRRDERVVVRVAVGVIVGVLVQL